MTSARVVVQVAPPSAVCSIAVPSPTIQPLAAPVNHTAVRSSCVGTVTVVQVRPPSVVRKTVPRSPTTHPVEASTKVASQSQGTAGPPYCVSQVAPPLDVCRMTPAPETGLPPTAHACEPSSAATL